MQNVDSTSGIIVAVYTYNDLTLLCLPYPTRHALLFGGLLRYLRFARACSGALPFFYFRPFRAYNTSQY